MRTALLRTQRINTFYSEARRVARYGSFLLILKFHCQIDEAKHVSLFSYICRIVCVYHRRGTPFQDFAFFDNFSASFSNLLISGSDSGTGRWGEGGASRREAHTHNNTPLNDADKIHVSNWIRIHDSSVQAVTGIGHIMLSGDISFIDYLTTAAEFHAALRTVNVKVKFSFRLIKHHAAKAGGKGV
jgi:hypothetical protein